MTLLRTLSNVPCFVKCPHSAQWENELFPSLCGLPDLFSLLIFQWFFFLTLQSFILCMYRSVLLPRFKETPSLGLSLSFSLCASPFSLEGYFTNFSHIDLLKLWDPSIQLSETIELCLYYLSLNCSLETVSRRVAGTIIVHISFVSFLSGHSPVLCFPMGEHICFSVSPTPTFWSIFLIV